MLTNSDVQTIQNPLSGLSFKFVLSILLSVLLLAVLPNYSHASEANEEISSITVIDSILNDNISLKDQVVYVDFWASWCVPCRLSFPWMQKMRDKYEIHGLKIITVNLDKDHQAATKFINELGQGMNVIYDSLGTVAELFKIEAMPTSFIYDRQGVLQSRHQGFKEKECYSVDSLIRSLLTEEKKQ